MTRVKRNILLMAAVVAGGLLAVFVLSRSSPDAPNTEPIHKTVGMPAMNPSRLEETAGPVQVGGDITDPLAKEFAADYAGFIAQFSLSERAVGVFLETLVGQFFSKTPEEREEYEKLLQTLLAPEAYAAFQKYRDRVPRVKRADAAVAKLNAAFPGLSTEAVDEMRSALVGVKPSTATFDKLRLGSSPLSDADIEQVRQDHIKAFDLKLKDLEPHISSRQIDFLREWYLRSPEVQGRLKVLKQLQQTRAAAAKAK